jgi:hypothetical protein
VSWTTWVAWAAVPVAFALELWFARRTIAARAGLVEAWLAAGARPFEALAFVRPRIRPALVIAALVLVPVLLWPPAKVQGSYLGGLAAIGAASIAASVLAVLRSFVGSRLAERPPAEARAPFRLAPYQPPASLEVHETRPPTPPDLLV